MTTLRLRDLYDLKLGDPRETLDCGAFTIDVQRRSDDWWACLNGNDGVWCCGKSLDFVVGYTVLTWLEYQRDLADPTFRGLDIAVIEAIVQKPTESDAQ